MSARTRTIRNRCAAVLQGCTAIQSRFCGPSCRPLGLAGGLAFAASVAAAQPAPVSFREQIRPILQERCAACHSGAGAQQGFRVASVPELLEGGESGPALAPGEPGASLIMSKIQGSRPAMPPTGEPLAAEEIALLGAWIAGGAPDDSTLGTAEPAAGWWSLQPLQDPPVERPESPWARTPIDGFLLAAMRAQGLAPAGEADRRTLIRRLTFDLHGLPPTPGDMEAFAQDPRPNAYEALVDRLLADPAYGERWGRHWLDVARFGESNGYEQNHLRERAWPYRDWTIRAFNEDKAFDRMILEQLAGDQLAPGDPAVQAATGFLVAGPHDTVGIKNPAGEAQKRANHLDDMIMGTASAFLGLTVHCARCHDHKFDPIEHRDYYRLQAAFAGVWHGERDWDSPAAVREFEERSRPLAEEIRACEEKLEALRAGARERIEARRASILDRYRPAVDAAGTAETFQPVEARFVRLTIRAATARRSIVDLDEFEIWTAGPAARNAALGSVATASSTRVDEARPDTYAAANLVDGKFDRRWISAQGLPVWIQVELPKAERIERVAWSSDRLGGFRGRFGRPQPAAYRVQVSLDGEAWTTVATSQGRLPFSEQEREQLLLDAVFGPAEKQAWAALEARKQAMERQLKRLPKPRRAFLGRFEEPPEPTAIMLRGDPMKKGEQVAPASLSALAALLPDYSLEANAPEAERRLALARWIASERNALTARVIANRIWLHHFGRPFVHTPSDFGLNGGKPTHPELLDWLAGRLVRAHGWRLKPLHREIVLSAAYRQSAEHRADAARIDSDGNYLWRFPPRRLSAEEVRDAILAVSGNLDRAMGGPGFRLYRYTVDNVATYYPLEEFSPATFRRSVYHQHARSVKPELLGQFDCPDTSLPAPKRISTTSPLQALSLLNNAFVLDQASAFSRRIDAVARADPRRRVGSAWRLAFGREPTEAEFDRADRFIDEYGLAAFSRAILNANEFLYVF